MMSKNPETVDLCDYLCTRLKQIGIQSVHGVPGKLTVILILLLMITDEDIMGKVTST